MAGEKSEKATPKRKQDERKKGNVFLSKEIVTIFTMMATFYAIKFVAPSLIINLHDLLYKYISMGAYTNSISMEDVRTLFIDGSIYFIKATGPVLLVCILVTIIATMGQTKMLFSAKAFNFKANRLNPLSGLKKMFSMRGIVELVKSLLKIIVLGYIIFSVLKEEVMLLPRLMDLSFLQAMIEVGNMIIDIVLKAGAIFAFLAGADYLYQWWDYEKNLRMSKQEIKDEYKQTEGDPQIKGRQRSMQQQRSRRRMMQNVPNADVVIRNPTHYAIALKFDQQNDRAPRVIAKGADRIALKIIEIAEQNNIYITEDKPLARALFDAVEVDREIPEQFYKPIAQVLAFVYSIKKKDQR